MKTRTVVFLLAFCLCSAVLCAQLSRITHILRFLSANVGAEPGSPMNLHSAYYGAETLHTLSKHAGYIQKNLLLASDYTYKLATFVSSLQANDDTEIGGFQAYPGERKDFNIFDGELVCSVVNSFFAGRVLEISDSPLGGGQDNYLKKVDTSMALKFLSNAKTNDLYSLHPGSNQVSVASVYYGHLAWSLFASYGQVPAGATPVQPEAILTFLKSLFVDGGFKHNQEAQKPDLPSTYQAVSLLKRLNLWDSFANNRKDASEKIHKFVLSHRDANTKAFGEASGAEPDVASTFWAVAIAKELGLEHVVDVPAVTDFVTSLQSHTDGGFKLHHKASSGHHSNTYYALETLELLGKVPVLEETLVHPERVVLVPQFIHNAAFVAMVVLVLVGFAGTLYLLPRSADESEDEVEETTGEKKGKDKKLGKKKKKEPTMTIIRDKQTKECVDKDGVPFPIDSLNKKEWDIVDTKEEETYTMYVLRKKEITLKQKLKDSPLKARRLKKK